MMFRDNSDGALACLCGLAGLVGVYAGWVFESKETITCGLLIIGLCVLLIEED